MIDLAGRVALVTGGARGIGRACAIRLARSGADVALNYLTSKSAARDVADEIERLGRRCVTVKADVSEPQDVSAMVDFVGTKFGRLDVLVSNAAGGGFRPLLDATERHFDAAMNTNARALLSLVRAAAPLLGRDGRRGKVIALSSHGSHRALPHYGVVGASKAALESLVRHFALELGPRGVNFNIVLAGLVDTDAIRGVPDAQELIRAAGERMLVPSAKLTPEDVADVVLFLASPLSDLVQGQTVVVDGGAALHG